MDLFGDMIADKARRIERENYPPPDLNVLVTNAFYKFPVILLNLVFTHSWQEYIFIGMGWDCVWAKLQIEIPCLT